MQKVTVNMMVKRFPNFIYPHTQSNNIMKRKRKMKIKIKIKINDHAINKENFKKITAIKKKKEKRKITT